MPQTDSTQREIHRNAPVRSSATDWPVQSSGMLIRSLSDSDDVCRQGLSAVAKETSLDREPGARYQSASGVETWIPAEHSQVPERRLAAVLTSQVVEFSRLLTLDAAGALADLRRDRLERLEPAIRCQSGRIVKLMGEGMLVEFGSVVGAVKCALNIQKAGHGSAASLQHCIGINVCDVLPEGDDIFGDGVNIAFRIEALAGSGGICITSSVHESVANHVNEKFTDMGNFNVKNIDRPIHVFRWMHGT